jgi:hypothetical protein
LFANFYKSKDKTAALKIGKQFSGLIRLPPAWQAIKVHTQVETDIPQLAFIEAVDEYLA